MSGVRSVKLAEGKRHEYVTQNGKVVRDKVTDASTGAFQYMLDFTYDESGHPLTMRSYFNEAQNDYSTYHYVLNAQGDVIKLMHGSNKTVAEYSYDAWGKLLRISGADLGNLSVAELNSLRYRGYYYDTETGFYYLQSRYYDPALGRFINADSYASTGQGYLGYNMFAYCNNNPVMSYDPTGHSNEAYYEWMYGAGGGSAMAGVGLVAAGVALASGGGGSLVDTVCSAARKGATALACAAKKLATTVADAVSGGSSSATTAAKSNRPSSKKVGVDMDHILSGHTAGGGRKGPGGRKDDFPPWMTAPMIEKAVREAYKNADKAGAMQYSWSKGVELVKQCFIGVSDTFGIVIELYLNYTTKTIDAAWPKW